MEGVILDFNNASGTGVVRCTQGARYTFGPGQWRGAAPPKAGDRVDFIALGDQATDLYQLPAPVAPPALPVAPSTAPAPSALAIISLIAGIVGLFSFGSLVAVICGHVARSNIRASNGTQTGDGMALAGLIMGYLGLALTVLIGLFFLIAVVAGSGF